MTPTDKDALTRAIVAARAESAGRAKQLDSMLTDRPWQEVAEFAAHCVQGRTLGLMPWQMPPLCYANRLDSALREPFGDPRGAREAGELLRRLLDAGLSKYEPDPLGGLERAEAERAKNKPAK